MVKETLNIELRKLLDSGFEDFLSFSDDINQIAERWSNVINNFASSVIPVSTTALVAKQQAKVILLGINNSGNGLALLTSAYSAYAATLASGMLGFVSVPPPLPPSFVSVLPLGMGGASGKEVADFLTEILYNWIKTGTATPTVGGTTINWQ